MLLTQKKWTTRESCACVALMSYVRIIRHCQFRVRPDGALTIVQWAVTHAASWSPTTTRRGFIVSAAIIINKKREEEEKQTKQGEKTQLASLYQSEEKEAAIAIEKCQQKNKGRHDPLPVAVPSLSDILTFSAIIGFGTDKEEKKAAVTNVTKPGEMTTLEGRRLVKIRDLACRCSMRTMC